MLSYDQAHDCMTRFLRAHYEKTKSDAIGDLLGDIDTTIWTNGRTGDPAAWQDWLDAVAREAGDSPLTAELAYRAMCRFLLAYAERTNFCDDIGRDLRELAYVDNMDQEKRQLWEDWLGIAEECSA